MRTASTRRKIMRAASEVREGGARVIGLTLKVELATRQS